MSFEFIWNRIKQNEGQIFYTVTNRPCSYEFRDTYLKLLNTNRCIPKTQIEQAWLMKAKQPSEISDFMAPSYIIAIITDKRIIG